MNGEGIPCSRTTVVEGAVTKPDTMGTRDQENGMSEGVSSGYCCCFGQCRGENFLVHLRI